MTPPTVSRFRVLSTFRLRKQGEASVLDTGAAELEALPLLGEYYENQVYQLTQLNLSGAAAAVAQQKAELL